MKEHFEWFEQLNIDALIAEESEETHAHHFTAHIDKYEKALAEGIEEETITEREAFIALSEYCLSESDTVEE